MPDSAQSKNGFTLIELLTVIAIIAILSTIAATMFTGAQARARDARRISDIDAISKALEAHYGDTSCGATAGKYCSVQNSWFSPPNRPFDPKAPSETDTNQTGCGLVSGTTGKCWYCIQEAAATYDYCTTGQDYLLNNSAIFTSGGFAASGWVVCANLESGSGNKYYCKGSVQ